MRTTFQTVNRNTQYVIGQRYSELADLQRQLSTGRRINRPSDDAVASSHAMKARQTRAQLEQNERNMNDAESWMKITDTTMTSMNGVLQRANYLAIQADNDTNSDQERAYIAEEIGQLARHMTSLTNSTYKGEYIFSGSHTDLPPRPMQQSTPRSEVDYIQGNVAYFDGSGASIGEPIPLKMPGMSPSESINQIIPGSVSIEGYREGVDYEINYIDGTITLLSDDAVAGLAQDFSPESGNYSPNHLKIELEFVGRSEDRFGRTINTNSSISREIEVGFRVPVNTTIDELHAPHPGQPHNDPILALIELGDALLRNDTDKIQESMTSIERASNSVLNAQARNASRINLVETTKTRNSRQQVEMTAQISTLEDADYAEVASQFTVAQTVFEAALSSTAKIMQKSLIDYVR